MPTPLSVTSRKMIAVVTILKDRFPNLGAVEVTTIASQIVDAVDNEKP